VQNELDAFERGKDLRPHQAVRVRHQSNDHSL
jgi:hypothetical protein